MNPSYRTAELLKQDPAVLKTVTQLMDEAESQNTAILSSPLSEDALALSFVDRHQSRLRYCAEINKYFRLASTPTGGAFWQKDTILATFDAIRVLSRNESVSAATENKQTRLCSAATITATEKLVRSDQRISAPIDSWDGNDMLLNTADGEVNLSNGKLSKAQPESLSSKITACGINTHTPYLWLSFLSDVTAGNNQLIAYLQKWFGYSLTGVVSEHAFAHVYGTGANGKSVFLNTLAGIMGSYSRTCPQSVFLETRGMEHPTALASLIGSRLAIATEVGANSKWAETQLFALTAGDEIAARFMRADYIYFKPKFKLMIGANHKPQTSTVNEALRRRLHLIPFDVTIPADKRDKRLFEKLKTEWPAILNWGVEGCIRWQQEGLKKPECVQDATDSYLEDQDVLGAFINDCCVAGANCRSKSTLLYKRFAEWCEQNNIFRRSKTYFDNAIQERPGIKYKHTEQGNYVFGVGLVDENGYGA